MPTKGRFPPLSAPPALKNLREKQQKIEKEKAPDSQWSEASLSETRLRSDSGYSSATEDTELDKRDIALTEVRAKLIEPSESSYEEDKKRFEKSMKSIHKALYDCYRARSRSQLTFWIQQDRYPVRQFRAYYLLGLDKLKPDDHEKLHTRMTELEQNLLQHRDHLLSNALQLRYSVASDLFNYLVATQAFLGKTSEALHTVQQGYNYEPGSIIFSLQDAKYDLTISNERVLEGFPPKPS
ncbi:hypothetical protein [Endozoicomonas arenosclerae]|uniref:hypothetical protein n=1 Tax=Endozoicomonas arenosclerae TaxID=1633495 RepID=UPI000785CBC3|nr:hypothetical protein [Endozoicomonas arenosclerae]